MFVEHILLENSAMNNRKLRNKNSSPGSSLSWKKPGSCHSTLTRKKLNKLKKIKKRTVLLRYMRNMKS